MILYIRETVTRARRLIGTLAVVLLAGALGSCAGDHLTSGPTGTPREPRLTPPKGPPEGVSFTGSVTSSEDDLVIRYEVVNNGDEPVVVFNRVPSTDSPNAQPGEPDRFYVIVERDGAVRISKQVFGTPRGVDVYARMVLGGTKVAEGDRVRERIEVDASLRPRHPYQGALGYDTEPLVEVDAVRLCIGVAVACKVTELTYDEAPHPMYAHDNPTANQQFLFCSAPHSVQREPTSPSR